MSNEIGEWVKWTYIAVQFSIAWWFMPRAPILIWPRKDVLASLVINFPMIFKAHMKAGAVIFLMFAVAMGWEHSRQTDSLITWRMFFEAAPYPAAILIVLVPLLATSWVDLLGRLILSRIVRSPH